MNVKFVGFERYSEYPCYEDENGKLYFDINFVRGQLNLHTGAYKDEFGDIYGEPNQMITGEIKCDKPFIESQY